MKDAVQEKELSKKEKKKEKRREAEYAQLDTESEAKRFNRIIGQIEGIKKMLDDRRKLEAVLTQCKAVHSALKSVELRVLKAHLEVALEELESTEKRKNREEKIEELADLYKRYED